MYYGTRYHAVPTNDGRNVVVEYNYRSQSPGGYGPNILVPLEEWDEFKKMINNLDVEALKSKRKQALLAEAEHLRKTAENL